ncbi:transcriptional regulator of acetoin/glycerol metabolism [Xanthomonas sp. F1]
MAQQPSQHQLGQARRAFFERGGAPVGQVPDTILQSWQRCQRLGLAADAQPAIEPLEASRLRALREAHERLWRLARAELEGLAGDAAATGSIVLLTDEAGWILDAEGSPRFLDKAGRVALMPGACWSETQVGTNAIGTAIVESRSVEVRGGEHYFAPHQILSCAAVPIFDPYGRLAGVLDISGDASVQHMHALALARMAVANIEHRYFDDGIAGCELLRVHHDPALLGTAREALLAFRNGRAWWPPTRPRCGYSGWNATNSAVRPTRRYSRSRCRGCASRAACSTCRGAPCTDASTARPTTVRGGARSRRRSP